MICPAQLLPWQRHPGQPPTAVPTRYSQYRVRSRRRVVPLDVRQRDAEWSTRP